MIQTLTNTLPLGGAGGGLLFIHWNPDLVIFSLGPVAIRWYSTCWLVRLVLSYLTVKYLYKKQGIAEEKFEPLFLYCFISILVGARLGHCLFYDPAYYLSSWDHFVEMLIPMRHLADGSWKFTGYEGLASHGGTLGLIIGLWLYCRNLKMNIWTVLDNIAIATPITACFIRLGNLMNSEIIGKVTDVPWAFIFTKVDQYPRHPGQLYEAIAYALFFFVGWFLYKKAKTRVGTGLFFGLCLTLIFTFRFFVEFTKDIQVDFEAGMPLDMGQLLSIPFVILGVACMKGGKWMGRLGAKQ